MGAYCTYCGTQLVDNGAFCHSCGAGKIAATVTKAVAAQPAPVAERVFFQDGGVTVTNTRFIVAAQTYAMAGVTSVRFEIIPAKNGWGLVFLLVGLFFLVLPDTRALGVLSLLVGILIFWLVKATYAVALHSSSGEVRAITSKDKDFIGKIVTALNEAVVYRN